VSLIRVEVKKAAPGGGILERSVSTADRRMRLPGGFAAEVVLELFHHPARPFGLVEVLEQLHQLGGGTILLRERGELLALSSSMTTTGLGTSWSILASSSTN
jgi:hypothetical protein